MAPQEESGGHQGGGEPATHAPEANGHPEQQQAASPSQQGGGDAPGPALSGAPEQGQQGGGGPEGGAQGPPGGGHAGQNGEGGHTDDTRPDRDTGKSTTPPSSTQPGSKQESDDRPAKGRGGSQDGSKPPKQGGSQEGKGKQGQDSKSPKQEDPGPKPAGAQQNGAQAAGQQGKASTRPPAKQSGGQKAGGAADRPGSQQSDKPGKQAGQGDKPSKQAGSRESRRPNSTQEGNPSTTGGSKSKPGSPATAGGKSKPGSPSRGSKSRRGSPNRKQRQEATAVVEEESEDEGPPPNPSWPNGPPEEGGNYVPVAELPPLPQPFDLNEEGRPVPFTNAQPVFLTSTTIDILGLKSEQEVKQPAEGQGDKAQGEGQTEGSGPPEQGQEGQQQPEQQQQQQQQQQKEGEQPQEGGQQAGEQQQQEGAQGEQRQQKQAPKNEGLLFFASRDAILRDIHFRGAISDMHAFKQRVQEANYNPLCFRVNEEDFFGDGSNFQVAFARDVSKKWRYIEYERKRREQCQAEEQAKAEAEKAQPRSKRQHVLRPWQSYGSEIEVEEAMVKPRREPVRLLVSKPRVEFNQAFRHYDKDAHELYNSSQMECRPFKDPNYDIKRMEQSVGVQAVKGGAEAGVQAGAVRPRPNATQAEPPNFPPEVKRAIIREGGIEHFLQRVSFECEQALIQNEITDIFRDDFAALSEEDGMSGNRKESIISEYQSFTHLTYSKNKVVSAIQWLPHRKGVVAVACTEAASHSERVTRAGRPANAYILIWNFKDPIHPEYVLQAPFEVFSFQYNPSNPNIIAAGCYNGQVVLWDTTHEHERIARMKAASNKQETQDAGDEAAIPIVKYKYATTIEFSHHHVIMDLQWLPGIEISSRGKVTKTDPQECSFLATTSGDGKVNFWDVRVDRLMKKGRKAEDSLDLIWKPTHSIHIISLIGMDLGGLRMCFNFRELDKGAFFVGSADGELVYAEFIRPEGEENPDYTKSCVQAHVAPIMALERSPFFDDIILTVGDWSFQIWREGHTSPLFTSGYASEMYTSGCWSPSRPAVIYLTDQAGNLEIWDMLDRSHEPSIKVTLASSPFMSMRFMSASSGQSSAPNASVAGGGPNAGQVAQQQQQAGQFLALGDSVGVLRIVEIPRNLRRPMPSERKAMGVFLERELERVADVEARKPLREASLAAAEEARKKAADEAEAVAKETQAQKEQGYQPTSPTKAGAAGKSVSHAAAVELDEKAEAEYFKLEHRLKVQLGLIEAPETDRR